MGDCLREDFINSLPQPLYARFGGSKSWWPVIDIGVDCPLVRIDVCGKSEVKFFCEVAEIKDSDGCLHDPDTFWTPEYNPGAEHE